MEKVRRLSGLEKNMIVSGASKPLSMLISYIYVPIALNYLGVEKYGIWSTILTILSWISYFDIGIGNGLRNRLTESLAKKDGESRKLVSSVYALTAIIMSVVATVFSIIASHAKWERIFGVQDIGENLAALVIISVIVVAINFVLSICRNILYALQKSANVSILEILVQGINLIGLLIARIFTSENLFVMVSIYGMSMITVNAVASVILFSKHKECQPSIFQVDIEVGKSVVNVGVQFLVIQLCALVLFTTDSFIISYMFGASDVTPYSTVNKLFNAVIRVYAALLMPTWGAVAKIKAENKLHTVKPLMRKLYMLMIPFLGGTSLLILLFRPIARVWLGMDLDYGNGLIIFGGFYCILNIWTNMHGCIANGLGILKEQMVMAIVQATVNIPLSIFFAREMNLGTAGILLGTNLSLLISSVWLPILIRRKVPFPK